MDWEKEQLEFYNTTVEEYKKEIQQYSDIIVRGNASIEDYHKLFNAYVNLYYWTKDDKAGALVSRIEIDSAASNLMKLVQRDIECGTPVQRAYAYTAQADVLLYRKDMKKALAALNKAIEIDPSTLTFEARGNFGIIGLMTGMDWEKVQLDFHNTTIEVYKKKIQQYSDIIVRGNASIEDYHKLFRSYVNLYEWTKGDKAGALVSRIEMDSAASNLMKLVQRDIECGTPVRRAYAYTAQADVLLYRKDKKKALAALNKAIEIDPSTLTFKARGHFKESVNDKKGAYKDYEKAIELCKDPEDIRGIRMYMSAMKGFDESRADWVKSFLYLVLRIILSLAILCLYLLLSFYR